MIAIKELNVYPLLTSFVNLNVNKIILLYNHHSGGIKDASSNE